MRKYLQDTSERVVGNAVFGLHLLHEADSVELLKQMMADQRPAFRATAAYLAGQIATPEAKALLSRATKDDAASVRLAAKQSMVQIRRIAPLEEAGRVAEPAGPAEDSTRRPAADGTHRRSSTQEEDPRAPPAHSSGRHHYRYPLGLSCPRVRGDGHFRSCLARWFEVCTKTSRHGADKVLGVVQTESRAAPIHLD